MTVLELLEEYVRPFLQACATLFILLNTQRISTQNWIKPLERTMRIIIEIWRAQPAPQELFIQNSHPLLSLIKLFKMKKKQNLPHSQFKLKKVSLEWLLLLLLQRFMRYLISHILIWLIQKNKFESLLLKKTSHSIICKHSPVILLF